MCYSFAQNLSFQFLPIFNRKLGADETQMGLLTAFQNVFSSLLSPFWGRASDKRGRRIFLIFGGLISFLSAIVITFANTPNSVIIAVAFNSIGISIFLPVWAGALADFTEGRARAGFVGRVSGIGAAYVTVAMIIFTLVIPYFSISEITQYRIVMGISAINFFIMTVIAFFYIDIGSVGTKLTKNKLFEPLKDKNYRNFLIVIMFWWLWMSLAWSYFPLVLTDTIDASLVQIAILGIVGTITQAISSYKFGPLIDKIGIRKSLIIGFLPFSLIPLFYGLATSWQFVIIPQLIGGIGIGFGFTAMQAYILEIAGSEKAGAYQGTYQILYGVVTFFGSLIGGVFLQWFAGYLGDLSKALTYSLFAIFLLRLLSNLAMIKFIPDLKSSAS